MAHQLLGFGKILHSSSLAANILILLILVGNTFGSVYSPFAFHASIPIATQPVLLQTGTAGSSTIYANSTSSATSVNAVAPALTYNPNNYNTVKGNWWSSNYAYRKRVTISNSATSPLSVGYSVLLTLDTALLVSAGKMLSGGNDLRLLYWNSSSSSWLELDRAIESMNTSSTAVWFKTQALIGGSSSDANYYVYYGYSSAGAPPANKSIIYSFWNDFDSLTGWTHRKTSEGGTVGTASVSNSVLTISPGNAGSWADYVIHDTYTTTDSEGFCIKTRARERYGAYGEDDLLAAVFFVSIDGNGKVNNDYNTRDKPSTSRIVKLVNGTSTVISSTLNGNVDNTWYTYETFRKPTDEMKLLRDGSQICPTSGWTSDSSLSSGYIGVGAEGINRNYDFDWILVRKYIDPEPSTSTGSEEREITGGTWYDPGWDFRKRITVNHAKVQADLANFPVLINITSDSDLASHAQSSGNDILFTSSSGVTKLSHEIEKYTSATGRLVAWVKVPNLSCSADANLYMYYGNSSCGSQQDASNVWDSSFKGVWHLKENPSGTAPQMKDSTTNGNHGTSYGTMTTGDQVEGKMDGSLDLDGANDEIQCGNAANLQITTALTIEAWVKRPSTTAIYAGIAGKLWDSSGTNYRGYNIQKHDTTNKYRFVIGANTTLNVDCVSDSAYTDTNWHYIVGVRRAGTNYLYVDSVQQTATSNQSITDSGDNFDIGRQYTSYSGRWWAGIIDEVRVSDSGRNASWIAACYNNQNSSSAFYTIGAGEENVKVSGTFPASIQYLDSDYFVVRSTPSAPSATGYNPSSYNLIGSTSHVSGTTNDLVTNNDVCMVFRSYFSGTTTAYNPSGYNLVGQTSLASGTLSNLASNDSSYMTFQSYPSAFSTTTETPAFMSYRSNTGTNTLNSPKNRSWNGTVWGSETEMPTAGSPVRLVRAACSPVAAYYSYKIVVTLSDDGYLDAYVYNGTAWSVSNNLADLWTTAPTLSQRPFDVAFSTTSGDALLVYAWLDDYSNDLAYRRWYASSKTWSSQVLLDDAGHFSEADYSFVTLSTDPTPNSDYIGAIAIDTTNSDAVAWTWSGSAFGNRTDLTGTVSAIDAEDVGIAFDFTGKLMIVAGEGSNEVIRRNQWTKTGGWGTSQATSDLDGSEANVPRYITLKADPSSDDLMLTMLDSGNDIHSLYWNGASWTSYANQDTDADAADQRCVDFDWEPTGSKGIQVRGTTAGQITWRTWTTGTGWGSDNNPAMGTYTHPWIQLRRNPRDVSGDVKILGAALEDTLFDLGAIKWNGTALTVIGSPTFTADTTTITYEAFNLRLQMLVDPTEYTSEVEFTGASNANVWTQLVWTVDSAWSTANVTATIQLYNWNTASYPASGDGYLTYTSSSTPNTDQTKTQTVTTNPQNYRDTGGNWKIKIKGVKSTSTSFQFKADYAEYKPTNGEYTSEIEFIGSSNTEAWTQLVWTVDSAWTTTSATVTIQVYNYTAGQYAASGSGYDSYTSSATANTDETRTKTVSINPTSYRNSSGYWKIKVKGVKATVTQFDFKADWIEFKPAHVSEYTVSTEFLFSGMTTYAPVQLDFTVVSEYNATSVNATIQVWNYSSSAYATSGQGYATYTSTGTNVTRNLNVSISPQFYVSNGNAKIKITGMKTTTSQYQQEINQVKLAYSYASSNYNYVLRMTENQSANWKIRLSAYNQSNIERLTNCTIYIYDGSNSTQISIANGTYSQQTGPWYDLTASDAEYIWIHVEASTIGTSYVHVHLEILVPNTTTYVKYILTFIIL